MASAYAWGIDIGNRALKALKLVRTADGSVRVDDFDIIEHEFILSNAGDNRETLIQTALAAFAARHPMKGGSVAVGVSGQQSFARFINSPPVETKKIPEIVRFEAIQQIPFPLDEVEWSYQLFQNEGSPDVEVGIFAMRKDLVNQHLKFFTDAGMNVQLVQMNPLAVYNSLFYDQQLKDTTMIIDLGADNADLIITEGEQIWMRSIPIGGNHFTEALVKQFKLRFEKAEEMKRNAATSKYGRQILQAMRPVFADLVSEIQRSIGFYSSVHRDSRIARVLALGGTFNLPGLQKYLQQNLSLEVHKVGSLGNQAPSEAKVATALNENLLSAVSAYGLALQGLDLGKINSSLLPAQIRRERMWKQKTKWFAAAAAACVAAPMLAGGMYMYHKGKLDAATPKYETNKKVVSQAKAASDTYVKEVQNAGAADRTLVTDIKGMATYRELWPQLYRDIRESIPSAAKPASARDAGTKSDRRIFIEEMLVDYKDDIGGTLAFQYTQFDALAAKRKWGGVITPGTSGPGGRNNAVVGSGLPARAYGSAGMIPMGGGAMTPGSVNPADPSAPEGGDPALKGQRGFLITLHVSTPNPEPIKLINEVVADALKRKSDAAKKPPADPSQPTKPRLYRIERVSVPSFTKFTDEDRKNALTERANAARERKNRANPVDTVVASLRGLQGGGGGGGGGGAFMPTPIPGGGRAYGGTVIPGAPGPGRLMPSLPPMQQGMPPSMTPAGLGGAGAGGGIGTDQVIDIYTDPVTGENVKDWSDVVVLIGVLVDPPAPAATPGDQAAQAAPASATVEPAAAPAPSAAAAPSPVSPMPAASPATPTDTSHPKSATPAGPVDNTRPPPPAPLSR